MSELATSGVIPAFTQADRLRKAREVAQIDQGTFAADLGVSRNTVTNYERGHVRPRRPVLLAWAMRTGVPLSWLETGEAPRHDDEGPAVRLPRLDSNQQPSGYSLSLVSASRAA